MKFLLTVRYLGEEIDHIIIEADSPLEAATKFKLASPQIKIEPAEPINETDLEELDVRFLNRHGPFKQANEEREEKLKALIGDWKIDYGSPNE